MQKTSALVVGCTCTPGHAIPEGHELVLDLPQRLVLALPLAPRQQRIHLHPAAARRAASHTPPCTPLAWVLTLFGQALRRICHHAQRNSSDNIMLVAMMSNG